ncbi:hypothetical protein GIB67_023655 [Kingdonia uniflora]|uniref:DUF4283 domain-containing protein n=1 Tax=Kingdonia uniflora TaxID=39325 RepID=A0A7J7NSZ4_9MAGN|nr:hypothetical protein GIB67_023655 [Kingdonia uniflora]
MSFQEQRIAKLYVEREAKDKELQLSMRQLQEEEHMSGDDDISSEDIGEDSGISESYNSEPEEQGGEEADVNEELGGDDDGQNKELAGNEEYNRVEKDPENINEQQEEIPRKHNATNIDKITDLTGENGENSQVSTSCLKNNQIEDTALNEKTSKSNIGTTVMNWAHMMGATPKIRGTTKLTYTPPTIFNGARTAFIKTAKYVDKIKSCEDLVVGNFIGRRLDYNFVKNALKGMWNTKAEFEMHLQGNSLFTFRFYSEEDITKVLTMGNVHISNKCFMVRPWRPYIETETTMQQNVPVWILLRNIPGHLWNPDRLAELTSAIGVPLCLDKAIEEKTKQGYARV